MEIYLNGFIKIGQEEHINALYNEGLVYCNTLKFFKEVESNIERKDDREGAIASIQINNFQIKVKDVFVPVNITNGTLNRFDSELYLTRIFCLFAITPEHGNGLPFIDESNRNFGSKLLLISNPSEFLRRIKASLNEIEVEYECGPVDYYDDKKSHHRLTVFHKPMRFKHQNEFRFHIKKKDDDTPFKFKIGSIKDISQILDVSVIPKLTAVKL